MNFKSDTVIMTGANGSGKTSLIEAIHIALQGKSWRSNFLEILRKEGEETADWWRIDLEFKDGEKRTIKFSNGEKTFEIGAQKFARLPAKFKKPVVLFEPNDLHLLYGSPMRRRNFFDRFIAQVEPSHASDLRKIERILHQRNNLLKQGTTLDELFVWDLQFAALAEKIIALRSRWIKKINENLTHEYQKIALNDDQVAIKYQGQPKSCQQILDQLKRDFALNWPYTKTGPQTHDIGFKINDHDARRSASRGESRTIIFAILAAMTKILNDQLDQKIYLLFDDIDSELDANRRNELYKCDIFSENYLFATTIKTDSKALSIVDLGDTAARGLAH